jgi:superfamily I DNA/RNA helicase
VSWVIERAIANGRVSSTVIVCRKRSDIDFFMAELKNKGHNATIIDKNTPGYANTKTVYLTTFHSAKGLEFENVFVPFLSEDKFPDPDVMTVAVSRDEMFANELKLLYVAATRSKYGLYMSYHGTLSFLFPKNSTNYDMHRNGDL